MVIKLSTAAAAAACVLLGGCSSSPSVVAAVRVVAPSSLRGMVEPRQLAGGDWYTISYGENQHGENVVGDGNHFTMTVKPDANSCKITGNKEYNGGRFEIKMTSASKMPGVVTAIYLASGEGRKGDEQLGDQDEIDFEFKGNEPMQVQTNVFLSGQEDLKILDVGSDTSSVPKNYAIQWDQGSVKFYVDNQEMRYTALPRPLKPLKLSVSVWTTVGGWPGVKKWAGETTWDAHPDGITASFDVVSLPN